MSTLASLIELEKQYLAQQSDHQDDVQEVSEKDETPGPELPVRVG